MEQPQWGVPAAEQERRTRACQGQHVGENKRALKATSATLKEMQNVKTSFLLPPLAMQMFGKRTRVRRISVRIFALVFEWCALRANNLQLESYTCS